MTRRGLLFIIGLALIASTTLTGCSVGKPQYSSETLEKATLHFVGLPGLLGAVGTSSPVSGSYSLTAAHVARIMPQLDVVAYHPACDIALIRTRNRHEPSLSRAVLGQPVDVYGYSARTSLPQTGHGKIATVQRSNGCKMFTTTAGAVQGMSGGGAFQGGKLVGILISIVPSTDESVIVPVQTLAPWLTQWGIEYAQ